MKAFTELYFELDRTTRTAEKLAALSRYLKSAPPIDAAWAVYVLTDHKIAKAIPSRRFRQWAAEESGFAPWLIDTSYHHVGDLSETIALLVPHPSDGADAPSLQEIVEQVIQPLGKLPESEQRKLITTTWKRLDADQCLVFHKLLGGSFRVGVSRQMLVNALADAAGIDRAVIAHRLAGHWKPDAQTMARLLDQDISSAGGETTLPYPFMLAHALMKPVDTLGEIGQWLLEWKWDGARAQIVRRGETTTIWSRGDELITGAFPEVAQAAQHIARGTVLDGEIVAWENGQPIPAAFQRLQTRLNRLSVEPTFWPETPVAFVAFDLLEWQGADVRELPLARRRALLKECVSSANDPMLKLSSPVECTDWAQADQLIAGSRERGVEGLMLKRLDAPYVPGRPTGLWWKLKIAPFTLDCVLIAAEPGRGKRAGLLTDYTFGVWGDDGVLVSMAKAYSGLDDAEIREMDRFIRTHTVARHGPVHVVEPTRVLEIAFEAIMRSTRHKSGIAVRFPRILRIRWDRKAESADTLERARAMLVSSEAIR